MERITLQRSADSSIETIAEQNATVIQSLLNGHWFSRRGTAADVVITPGSTTYTTPTSGSFTVSYRVSFFYACDGIELGQREQSKILFTQNDSGDQLTLSVEPEPERYDEL